MPYNPLTTWWHEVMWPIKNKYLLFCKTYAQKNCQISDLWLGELTQDVARLSEHVVMWSHVTSWKLYICSSKRSMITKLCRVVTYDGIKSPMMSRDSLTTKSHEVTWQNKNEIFSLEQRLWPPTWEDDDL